MANISITSGEDDYYESDNNQTDLKTDKKYNMLINLMSQKNEILMNVIKRDPIPFNKHFPMRESCYTTIYRNKNIQFCESYLCSIANRVIGKINDILKNSNLIYVKFFYKCC